MSPSTVARLHRWLGLSLTFPLLGWIVSSQLLHYVGMTAPNGLQGVYQLNPYNSVDIDLAAGGVLSPSEILARVRGETGSERIYWLRLQAFGKRLLYTVKPSPFDLEMTFDAISGDRLDPLDADLMLQIAAEKLVGTAAVALQWTTDFNRDYEIEEMPAALVEMEGVQKSRLMLARHSGRTLRRFDDDASSFNWWYHNFHVFQWGKTRWLFTAILFAVGILVVLQVGLGARLWKKRKRSLFKTGSSRQHRNLHRHRVMGAAVALFLVTQMLVGAYMWLNLGPFEWLFRGKNTFATNWTGGIKVGDPMASANEILGRLGGSMASTGHPVQSIEWRNPNGFPIWVLATRRDQSGAIFLAPSGRSLERLEPDEAGAAASRLFSGEPSYSFTEATSYYWNDLNRPIPAYRFRLADFFETDAFVSQSTGEVISRRTNLWRAFGPFLRYHSFAWTQNRTVDTALLILFQLTLLGTIISGWRVHFIVPRGRKMRK